MIGRWQRQRVAAVLGLIATGLTLPNASARAPVPAASGAVVLQTFPAGRFVLDLAIASCRRSECPIEVRLRTRGRVVDRVTLPVAASSQHAKPEAVDAPWGADAGGKAWASGEENAYVATTARLLGLAPQTTALLVSQRYGFEHLKRNHLLIVLRAGKLEIVWKAQEGAGPTWSATHILEGRARHRREIVYMHGFSEPDDDMAERLDAVLLSWDAASARLRETALPARTTPLYLLKLRIHNTVAQARQERSANARCLSPYWVLDASRFHAGADGSAIIGMLYASPAQAEAAARSVRRCLPGATAPVVTWAVKP